MASGMTMDSPSMEQVNEYSKNSNTLDISVGSGTHDEHEESADGTGYDHYQHMKLPIPDLKNTLSMQVVYSDNDSRGYESDSNHGDSTPLKAPKSQTDQKSDVYSLSDANDDVLGGNKGGYRLEKPTVVMLGIGWYEDSNDIYKHLEGVPSDYRNLINLFVNELNYSFAYQTDDGNVEFLTKAELIKLDNKYQTNFKIKWSSDEIINFIQSTKSIISEKRADSLIFIISSHSDDTNTCIIDSNCNKFSLNDIYSEFTNEKDGLPYLNNKPKIIIVDTPYTMKIPQVADDAAVNPPNDANQPPADDAAAVDAKNAEDNDEKENLKQNNNNNKLYESLAGFKDFCFIFNNLDSKGGKDGGFLCNSLPTALKKDPLKMLQQKNPRELNKVIEAIAQESIKIANETGDDKFAAVTDAITFRNNIEFEVNFS